MAQNDDRPQTSDPSADPAPSAAAPRPGPRVDRYAAWLSIFIALFIVALVGGYGWWTGSRDDVALETTLIASAGSTPEPWPTVATATPSLSPVPSQTTTPVPSATPTLRPTATATASPTPTPTPIINPIQVRELGYLTTLEYKVQTAVEVSRPGTFPLGGEDRILLLAVGEVQAGVDLSGLDEPDISIDQTSIRLTLPRAEIVSIELNLDETEVYDSRRRWLFSNYDGIEIEALDKAQAQIEAWAINQANVLELAESSARHRLANFLYQLGFDRVIIEFESPSS